MARARRIPADRSAFAGADYVAAFRLETPAAPAGSGEQWARAVFEGLPAALRLALSVGWRAGLGLQLASRRSPDLVAGWSITDEAERTCTLHAESRLIAADNRVDLNDTGVVWTTTVHYRNWLGRVLWRTAAPIHQLTLPRFLTNAERTLSP